MPLIEQDFSAAVRPVFFYTDQDDFLYATHGGTLFLVSFRDKLYAVTCGHVFKDFPHGMLFVTQEKLATKGSMPAHVTGICYPSSPIDALEGTDISDICVIEFSEDTRPEFFKGTAYIVDERTVATSKVGDELFVAGVLKEKTTIVPPDISIGYCKLSFRDCGPTSDPILRRAFAVFAQALFGQPEFSSVTGMTVWTYSSLSRTSRSNKPSPLFAEMRTGVPAPIASRQQMRSAMPKKTIARIAIAPTGLGGSTNNHLICAG